MRGAGGEETALTVARGSNRGTVSLNGDRLAVSSTVDDLFYEYDGTYTRAPEALQDCQ